MHGEVLFAPEWGTFDMAVGEKITSVYGGSADQSAFPLYSKPLDTATQSRAHSKEEQALYDEYELIRTIREEGEGNGDDFNTQCDRVLATYPDEWLLLFELAEYRAKKQKDALFNRLFKRLSELKQDVE